ncbi:M48 family metallopeptidase [Ralstonia solanacearum]|uniref:M48 family metallopeptidase n=1 Tax=Ralstonia solanacearum TaxID=305 RepID=UPI0005C5669D|nr:M48 family metallopeptidase [Ralstonia solanacearum]MBB6591669.1 M48 family metallopeptidase [Ralstonia solanacearum]MBB6595892.1 M48 family metallopeptidase [Ralstonia solanacearum]MDB0542543.1 M48 family metallopeptidase [Ralstonia solanacearum]MDB0552770.1 M48 family metallopeptidase [Ralstonia solanacearum]MDB0557549.1 M48 family metallopeptidase [Ralstonia solanacearum]
MPTFTAVFLIALVLMAATRLWLASRQIRHVSRHRDTVPAQFAESITLDMHHKAADYTIARTRLAMLEVPVQAALLIGLTLLGGLNWLNQAWLSVFGPGYAYGVALIVSVIAISSLVELPFSLYSQFVVEERFGFNRMTWKLWLADNLKGLAIGAALGLPLLLAVLWLMHSMGEYWWLYTWLVWMAFTLFVQAIYPNVIAPLYNKFTPLEDGEMRTRIEGLLKRCGFASKGLFVMDGSRRSAHGNAYFSGFGATKRIVFFDTLLARLDASEMEAVLAHELGHFKRHHITKRIAVMFVLSLGLLALLGWLMTRTWFYLGLGVAPNLVADNHALALMLFFLALPVFMFFVSPLGSLSSRKHEFEADAFAAQHAEASRLVSALVKLFQDNASTLTPDPIYSAFYYSHPTASQRVARLVQAGA